MWRRLRVNLAKKMGQRHVAAVRLSGVIMEQVPPRPNHLNVDRFGNALEASFASNPKAVALCVNSPGGSVVQSDLFVNRIRQLKETYGNLYNRDIPVISFIEDMGLSGGYYISCAGDKIVAQRASLVGSVGVIFATFGFTETMEKLGVERRVHTAGKNKLQLDPFSPEKPEQIEKLHEELRTLHDVFKGVIRDHRKDKIAHVDEEVLFNGDFWTGERAKELGLVDEIGDVHTYCRRHFPDDIGDCRLVWYKPRPVFSLGM